MLQLNVEQAVKEIEELEQIGSELRVNTIDSGGRKRKATEIDGEGRVTLEKILARKRRKETYDAAKKIHKGTDKAAEVGLYY